MPVRTPSNRYGRHVVGKFPSLKLDRMVGYESRLEQEQIYLMEYDPAVVFYEEQPLLIEYTVAGTHYKYFPDFRVVTTDGQQLLLECKAEEFVGMDNNLRKIEAGQSWCARRRWEFRLITERETRAGFRLENVMLLWQFARYRIAPDTRARLYAVMNCQPMLTLAELAARVSPADPPMARIPILHLLFHHELATPVDEARITGNSPIYLPHSRKVGR